MKDLNLFRVKDSIYLREVSSKADVLNDLDCDGFLIRSSESEARRIIESLNSKMRDGRWQVAGGRKKYIIALIGGDDAFNRRAVESLKIDYLVSPEALTGYDNLKQRDSGLNHVVAKMAKDKDVKIVVDMGDIRRLMSRLQVAGGRLQASRRIARVMQNIRICRKAGCGIRIGSFVKSKDDIVDELGRKAFGVGLGMSSGEVRDAIRF